MVEDYEIYISLKGKYIIAQGSALGLWIAKIIFNPEGVE
jgi:hypothetical protein